MTQLAGDMTTRLEFPADFHTLTADRREDFKYNYRYSVMDVLLVRGGAIIRKRLPIPPPPLLPPCPCRPAARCPAACLFCTCWRGSCRPAWRNGSSSSSSPHLPPPPRHPRLVVSAPAAAPGRRWKPLCTPSAPLRATCPKTSPRCCPRCFPCWCPCHDSTWSCCPRASASWVATTAGWRRTPPPWRPRLSSW